MTYVTDLLSEGNVEKRQRCLGCQWVHPDAMPADNVSQGTAAQVC